MGGLMHHLSVCVHTRALSFQSQMSHRLPKHFCRHLCSVNTPGRIISPTASGPSSLSEHFASIVGFFALPSLRGKGTLCPGRRRHGDTVPLTRDPPEELGPELCSTPSATPRFLLPRPCSLDTFPLPCYCKSLISALVLYGQNPGRAS